MPRTVRGPADVRARVQLARVPVGPDSRTVGGALGFVVALAWFVGGVEIATGVLGFKARHGNRCVIWFAPIGLVLAVTAIVGNSVSGVGRDHQSQVAASPAARARAGVAGALTE